MELPNGLRSWTADEVAECLDIPGDLSGKLWGFLDDAQRPTPLGGDGSDGTIETPDGRLDESNDDKAPHWWPRLSEAEQTAIATAFRKSMVEIYGDDEDGEGL
jgi:hypothetical protein